MRNKRVVVPQGMIEAGKERDRLNSGYNGFRDYQRAEAILEAGLRWLSENPIIPTQQQALDMVTGGKFDSFDNWELVRWGACEWQRRMFLSPETDIPQAVKDVFLRTGEIDWSSSEVLRAVECYRLGQQSK